MYIYSLQQNLPITILWYLVTSLKIRNLLIGYNSKHYYGCYNYGTLEMDIIFTITDASAKNPDIFNLESNKELTPPDFSNATVLIDT